MARRRRRKLRGRDPLWHWSVTDDLVLRRVYIEHGLEAALARLPHRTRSAILGRAHKLGIRRRAGARDTAWTRAEDRVMARLYPDGGWRAVHRQLPDRARSAIIARACRLGIVVDDPSRLRGVAWSKEEDAIVRRLYPTKGLAAAAAKLPRRNPRAIQLRAFRLGVRRPGVPDKRPWTPKDDAVIRRLYPEGGPARVARALPRRTETAIRSRASRIGVTRVRDR